MLAVGDLDAARLASEELARMASGLGTDVLIAIAAHAASSIALAQGDPHAVLEPARRSFCCWQRLGAPYLAARLRVLIGRACLALDDAEGARLELHCAREVFEKLGAVPDRIALDALATPTASASGSLTGRELQVLRLLATGKTNKAIARELGLSDKTIDRHLSNIFGKIDVATRAAATAFAYERKLI
jgi:ATP/maltotriose-dependent transcriptional regulator MalT